MANPLVTNYDNSKIFLGGNYYRTVSYTNATGAELTIAKGTVIDRVTATGAAIVFNSGTAGNNKKPIGIAAEAYVLAIGATATITICVDGEVDSSKIVLANGADTLATVVSGSTIEDLIQAWTAGIKCVASTELSGYDNQ